MSINLQALFSARVTYLEESTIDLNLISLSGNKRR